MNYALSAGLILNSALYFMAVLVVGLSWHNAQAVEADIIAIAATYLSYFLQMLEVPGWAKTSSVGLSITLGTVAGLLLL